MNTKRKGETSYKETSFGIIPRSKLIPLEIEGIKRAWDFILKERKKGRISISIFFLQEIHKIGFGWIFPEMAGKLRKIEVTVSKHKPPEAHYLPELMKNFTEDLNIRFKNLPLLNEKNFFEELLEILAWAHHKFLWIHPFTDYNGRIGRLLINIILLNLDLPPIELKVDNKTGRTKYIKALQKADEGHYDLLKKIIQTAITEAAKNFS